MPQLIVLSGRDSGGLITLESGQRISIRRFVGTEVFVAWRPPTLQVTSPDPTLPVDLNGIRWEGGAIHHGDILQIRRTSFLFAGEDLSTVRKLAGSCAKAEDSESRIAHLAALQRLRNSLDDESRAGVDAQEDALRRDLMLETGGADSSVLEAAWNEYSRRLDAGEPVRFEEVLARTSRESDRTRGPAPRRNRRAATPSEEERLPRQLDDVYLLLCRLGRGAGGTVYEALYESSRIDAVKVLRYDPSHKEVILRFCQEAALLARIRHPNIVRIHGVRFRAPDAYIAMELIEGETLARKLDSGALGLYEGLSLMGAVASAVYALHREGIVHRDLKPANIMVTPVGRPVVMDFGFAKDTMGNLRLTMDGEMCGTPYYTSPEQARGKAAGADARSDVFSLGSILYHMLTGAPPFTGRGVFEILDQVVRAQPRNPKGFIHRSPLIQREFARVRRKTGEEKLAQVLEAMTTSHFRLACTICMRALQKEPANRYATAHAFQQALEIVLSEAAQVGLTE